MESRGNSSVGETVQQTSGTGQSRSILMLGGTGTIGRATVASLISRGHKVTCIARQKKGIGRRTKDKTKELLHGCDVIFGDAKNRDFLEKEVFSHRSFDTVYSCMASRTGEPKDAWAVDYQAHADVLALAKESGVTQMVLLSAICVQKPKLVFQHAKLKFEQHRAYNRYWEESAEVDLSSHPLRHKIY